MENKNEPLLKEEKELFGFQKLELEQNKSKDKKRANFKFSKIELDKEILTTGIIAIFVIIILFRTLYAFYIGFKYYDLRYEDNTTTEVENTNKD